MVHLTLYITQLHNKKTKTAPGSSDANLLPGSTDLLKSRIIIKHDTYSGCYSKLGLNNEQ